MASLPLPPSSAQLSAVMPGEGAGTGSKLACALLKFNAQASNAHCLHREHAVVQLCF